MIQSIAKYQNFYQYLLYTRLFRAPGFIFQKIKYFGFDEKKSIQLNMRLGHKIELLATQPYLKRIVFNRSYHDEGTFYLEPFLTPGAVIIDIGANIGLLTCAYATQFKHLATIIYAIEAVDQNHLRLLKNIDINGFNNIKPFRLAFGKEKGSLRFLLPSKEFSGNAVGDNVLSKEDLETLGKQSNYEEVVPLDTLDNWARENNVTRCDFIKIDIEGAELAVFEGGVEFIKKTRPLIQCEYNKHWLEQQCLGISQFVDFFSALKYSCYVDVDNKFVPLDQENFPYKLVDILFIPYEKIKQ